MNRRPIALASLPLILLAVIGLSGCAPLPVVTVIPTNGSDADPTNAPADPFTPDAVENLEDIVSSGNTQPLLGYLSDPVTAVIAGSEFGGEHTPEEATDALTDFLDVPDLPTVTWDFDLDDATLTAYRAGFYGQFFPDLAVVGRASDGRVVSFVGAGSQVTTFFLAAQEEQLTE